MDQDFPSLLHWWKSLNDGGLERDREFLLHCRRVAAVGESVVVGVVDEDRVVDESDDDVVPSHRYEEEELHRMEEEGGTKFVELEGEEEVREGDVVVVVEGDVEVEEEGDAAVVVAEVVREGEEGRREDSHKVVGGEGTTEASGEGTTIDDAVAVGDVAAVVDNRVAVEQVVADVVVGTLDRHSVDS